MGGDGVDQLAPLEKILAQVYQRLRPARMAVVGCGTGNGLEAVDPTVTQRFVGVDLNPEYLSLARARHPRLATIAEWMCADVAQCTLGPAGFDLIHAALLFEYVEPAAALPRIAGWLAPGGVFSVVLQLAGGDARISPTAFASLQKLSGLMRLVSPEELRDLTARVGLTEVSSAEIGLSRAKSFWAGSFARR